jgi:signal transduction histidine kinase
MKGRLNRWFFTRHLDDDEEISIVVHRHWLIGLQFLFWPTASFFGCLFLLAAYDGYASLFYAIALWTIVSAVWFLRNFFDYYLDAWIITDQGIIDVAWHGWFHRESTRVLFSDIQGVSYEIQGVMSTLLRYGVVSVEKISTGNSISLDHVPRPKKIEMAIMKHMEGYMHSKNLKDARHIQELLSSVIAREVQLEQFEEQENDEVYEDDGEE